MKQETISLFKAIENGSYENVIYSIKAGADLNAVTYIGNTPLTCAVRFLSDNNTAHKIIKSLINNGAKVNQKDKKGLSPLFYAIKYGMIKKIKILIKKNAERHWIFPDNEKLTATELAINSYNRELEENRFNGKFIPNYKEVVIFFAPNYFALNEIEREKLLKDISEGKFKSRKWWKFW